VAQLRIALAQANATVGDLDGNSALIADWTRRAAERDADLVVFPEMFLTGYPVEDLVLRTSFVDASIAALEATARRLAEDGLGGLPAVVGYVDRRADVTGRVGQPAGAPLDAAALLYGGRVAVRCAKHHLPNYGVFDEYRYFMRGDRLPVFRLRGVDVAIAICEDLWQDGGPVTVAREAGAGLLVVPNASPYERNKDDVRLELCARRAREAGCPLAYVNMVGGQDELVFDGDSLIVSADGELLARGPQFTEDLLVADLDLAPHTPLPPLESASELRVDARDGTTMTVERLVLSEAPAEPYPPEPAPIAEALGDLAEVYSALVLGTRDYVRKNGFRTVILGLSGGIDSALVATIAADAIGPGNVHTVLMPSRYSTEHSVTDAEKLVKRQGLQGATVPIRGIVDAYGAELDLHGLAAENLQARVRGNILMGLSNEHGHLVLTTGNKSELATGYSTLYGDSAGGFGPIKDVPKTLVWDLCRWRNEQGPPSFRPDGAPPIPQAIIDKPPSAELRPGQLDTDSLPPYEVLDAVLDDYVEKDMGHDALIAAGHDPELVERVIRLVDAAEYKRRQYPPGPKITPKNFGRDRRLPITNRWREIAAPHTRDPARVAKRQT
jgi:NAD+ synthase (glutamine-hydrolysing)